MAYVDGFLVPVPTANKDVYRTFASEIAIVFKEHGALSVVECWGDDVPDGKLNLMRSAVLLKDDETVVFAWISWPDRTTRDAGMAKVTADPRNRMGTQMPFDTSRMIFGGFEMFVCLSA